MKYKFFSSWMVICHMAISSSYYYNLWKVLRIESALTKRVDSVFHVVPIHGDP